MSSKNLTESDPLKHPSKELLREFYEDYAVQGYLLVILAVIVMILFASMATAIGQFAFHGFNFSAGLRDPRQWARVAIVTIGLSFILWSLKHKLWVIRHYENWSIVGWGLMGMAMGCLILWQYIMVQSGSTDEPPHGRYGSAVLMVTLAIYMSTLLSTRTVLLVLGFPSLMALVFALRFLTKIEVSSYLAYLFICHVLGMSYSTYRKRRELELFVKKKELNAAMRLLEEAAHRERVSNEGKSKVIAAVSHDLRQPLNSLALYNNLLSRRVLGLTDSNRSEFVEMVTRIGECVGAMEGNLTRLQEIAQFQSRKVQVKTSDVALAEVVARVVRVHEPQALESGVRLVCRLPANAVFAESNPERLFEIVGNLVSNAVKFASGTRDSGAIVLVAVRRDYSKGNQGAVRIEVRDNGPGIAEADQSRIFDEYVQLGNEERRGDRGYGLGLSIVRELCAALSHEVRVRSVSGKGAVFFVGLREASAEKIAVLTQIGSAAFEACRGANVLLVEDDETLRDALTKFLSEAGVEVRAYSSGRSALAATANDVDRPTCIISDYRLPPPHSGIETVIRLRDQYSEKVPALIMSGDIKPPDMVNEIGGCTFVAKPVSPESLLEYIARQMPPPHSGSTPNATKNRDTML